MVYFPEFDALGQGERLEGRAHFIGADVDAVDLVGIERIGRIVGIEIGQRDQRDHLAGVDVHDGARRGLGPEMGHAIDEFVAHDGLGAQVDRELHRLHVGRTGRIAKLLQVTHATLAVQIFFNAGNALVVDVHATHDMAQRRAIRINALVLHDEADAGQAELVDRRLLLGRDLALEPEEALARGQLGAQVACVEVGQLGRQQFGRLVDIDDLFRLDVKRGYLHVGGQDAPIAIDDVGTRRGELVGGRTARVKLLVRRGAELGQPSKDADIDAGKARNQKHDAARALLQFGRAAARRGLRGGHDRLRHDLDVGGRDDGLGFHDGLADPVL